jgi:hypothetical protein
MYNVVTNLEISHTYAFIYLQFISYGGRNSDVVVLQASDVDIVEISWLWNNHNECGKSSR